MRCVDTKKDKDMAILKKILPFILALIVGAGLAYLFIPRASKQIDKVIETVPDVVKEDTKEPKQEVIIDEVCEPEIKTVYKDRIVYKYKTKVVKVPQVVYMEKTQDPGCHVDWDTKKVSAQAGDKLSLRCTVDWKRKKVYTRYFGAERPLRRN